MADVKWIKLVVDMFDDEKIKIIEGMPNRDEILIIWIKLLLLAGKTNNNGVFLLSDTIPYTDDMLAAVFCRDVKMVRLSLEILSKLGIIEIVDEVVTIPNWSKYQTLDAYEKKKERDRLYQQERREKQRALIKGKEKSSDNRLTVGRDCSYSYSQSESTSLISLEDNKDISNRGMGEEEKGKEETFKAEIKEVIDYLNSVCGTRYRASSQATAKQIRARLREGYTVDDFKTVVDKKHDQWAGTDMAQYLTPNTLFCLKHFDNYLNEPVRCKWMRKEKTLDEIIAEGL